MPEKRPDGPVVVTGGAGAIGLFVVERLLAEGREVRVVDNFSTGRKELLPSSRSLKLTTFDLGTGVPPAAVFRGPTRSGISRRTRTSSGGRTTHGSTSRTGPSRRSTSSSRPGSTTWDA